VIKKVIISGFLVLFSLSLIACGAQDNQEQEEEVAELEAEDEIVEVPNIMDEPDDPVEEIISEDELADEDQVVLIVNGEEVYGEHYNLVYFETKVNLLQNDQSVEDLDLVHEEAMEALIRQTLLVQDAEKKGIIVTDSEAEAIFQDTKAQFDTEEDFYQTIEQLPYTEAVFRQILEKSLLQQYYIDQEFSDIRISSNDIEDFYAILKEQMEDPPDLADIRTNIENRLYQTEIQMTLNERIDQLKIDAEIEIKF